jgi:multidrug efflux pump subunit AcrA (membrane-fusion protein)
MAMSSNYNTRPRAAEVMVDGDQAFLVRRRETSKNFTRWKACCRENLSHILTVGLALALLGKVRQKKTDPPPVPMTATQAVARDIPVKLQVVGRAEAFESVVMKSRVDGQVAAVSSPRGST